MKIMKKPIDMWDLAARDAMMRKIITNLEKRQAALSIPITAEDIIYHSQFLEAVPYAGGFCWIYVKKSTGGRTGVYARMKYHGVWVQAHRFALAAKLGCTLWDLEDSKAGHAKASTCLGGRCCKHMHLKKEDTTAAGAWARSKDKTDIGSKPKRSAEQIKKMIRRTCDPRIPAHTQRDCFPLPIGQMVLVGEGDSAFTISVT